MRSLEFVFKGFIFYYVDQFILLKLHFPSQSFEDLRILHQEESISTEALEHFLKILKSDRTFIERFIETQKGT